MLLEQLSIEHDIISTFHGEQRSSISKQYKKKDKQNPL